MKRKIPESVLQRAILEWLQTRKGIYFFRSGAGQVRMENGRFFKTGKPGCPDITVCKDGQFYGVEVKTKTGRQSATQKKAQQEIEDAGGVYRIVRSLEDVRRLFP